MITWLKRRFEILKRNLTWYEWLVITVMGPVLSVIFSLVAKSFWEQMRPSVGDRLETVMIYVLL